MIKLSIVEMFVLQKLNSNILIHIQIFKDVVNDWIFKFLNSYFQNWLLDPVTKIHFKCQLSYHCLFINVCQTET